MIRLYGGSHHEYSEDLESLGSYKYSFSPALIDKVAKGVLNSLEQDKPVVVFHESLISDLPKREDLLNVYIPPLEEYYLEAYGPLASLPVFYADPLSLEVIMAINASDISKIFSDDPSDFDDPMYMIAYEIASLVRDAHLSIAAHNFASRGFDVYVLRGAGHMHSLSTMLSFLGHSVSIQLDVENFDAIEYAMKNNLLRHVLLGLHYFSEPSSYSPTLYESVPRWPVVKKPLFKRLSWLKLLLDYPYPIENYLNSKFGSVDVRSLARETAKNYRDMEDEYDEDVFWADSVDYSMEDYDNV